MLWKVLTHMVRATGPTRPPIRSFISPAALLVKVMATTSCGCAVVHLDEVGHPVREHARLARARAGEDEQRALEVRDGLALRFVEPGQQRVLRGAHPCVPPSSRLMMSATAPASTSLRPASHSRSRPTRPRNTPSRNSSRNATTPAV